MDGSTLAELISRRHRLLTHLLDLSAKQIEVIKSGRMSELMALLADKQTPLVELGQISDQLREAAGDDPKTRSWPSESLRERCRQEQEECEQMHIELLAIEAESETSLVESRESLQKRLERIDSANQAATKYVGSDSIPTTGNRLDLSSD